MELESRTKQIIPSFFAQPHHHPTPASTPHHFSCGRSSGLCTSLDTPLSFYVANRSKLRTVTHSHDVQVGKCSFYHRYSMKRFYYPFLLATH